MRELTRHAFSLDVIFVGEDDDSSGVARLHQALDDLVELSGRWLAGNLHRLSDADAAWPRDGQTDGLRSSHLILLLVWTLLVVETSAFVAVLEKICS